MPGIYAYTLIESFFDDLIIYGPYATHQEALDSQVKRLEYLARLGHRGRYHHIRLINQF